MPKRSAPISLAANRRKSSVPCNSPCRTRPRPQIPVLYIEMDGTGVPVVTAETQGRRGKNPGETAHTRDVKIRLVFTQTDLDEKCRPVRDEASTTYTGAIEPAHDFGRRMYTEALHRGWDHAKVRVILGDGAVWIWNIADREFPGAVQIVDLYHAREHLWGLAGKLVPTDERRRKRWASQLQSRLDKGKIESHLSNNCVPFQPPTGKPPHCCIRRPTTSNAIANACAIPHSAPDASLSVPG